MMVKEDSKKISRESAEVPNMSEIVDWDSIIEGHFGFTCLKKNTGFLSVEFVKFSQSSEPDHPRG